MSIKTFVKNDDSDSLPCRNRRQPGLGRVDDDQFGRRRRRAALRLRARRNQVLLSGLAPDDDALEPAREEGVEEAEGDADPAEDDDEGAVHVRGVGVRVPDVGEVGEYPEDELDEADKDGALGLRGQVRHDVPSLGLRLGHVEEDDDGVDDADGGDQEHVVEEDGLGDVVPGDKAPGVGAQLVAEVLRTKIIGLGYRVGFFSHYRSIYS